MKKEIIEWAECIVIALVLALLFKTFVGTPTTVKHSSMYPTLQENQRLFLNRTFRTTKRVPKVGEIITFEAPTKVYTELDKNQENPVAVYENEVSGIRNKFIYKILEVTKKSYIKRVIATEGQHVEIKNGKVYVNEKELEEEYLSPEIYTKSEVFNDFIVPQGYIFAMGDNREKSIDCREIGCIPLEKVEGIVVFRFWPIYMMKKF